MKNTIKKDFGTVKIACFIASNFDVRNYIQELMTKEGFDSNCDSRHISILC
jgi:hypothetical protein